VKSSVSMETSVARSEHIGPLHQVCWNIIEQLSRKHVDRIADRANVRMVDDIAA